MPATSSAGPPSSALTVDTGSDHAGPSSQKPQLTTGTVSLLPPQNDQTLDLYCSICGKSFNSQIQAQQHYNGKQHKNREEQQLQAKPVESFPDAVVIPGVGLAGSGEDLPPSCVSRTVKLGHNIKAKLLRCEACNITLNSEVQFSQHNRGLRHKMMTGQVTVTPPQEDAGMSYSPLFFINTQGLTKVVSDQSGSSESSRQASRFQWSLAQQGKPKCFPWQCSTVYWLNSGLNWSAGCPKDKLRFGFLLSPEYHGTKTKLFRITVGIIESAPSACTFT